MRENRTSGATREGVAGLRTRPLYSTGSFHPPDTRERRETRASVEASIGDGLGDVGRSHPIVIGEIGDGPRHPQDPVPRPRREPERSARVLEQPPAVVVRARPGADRLRTHVAV